LRGRVASVASKPSASPCPSRQPPVASADLHWCCPGLPVPRQFPDLGVASVDPASDYDKDGSSDLAEFIAGTLPDAAQSQLRIEEITLDANGDILIKWQAVAGKTYTLETNPGLEQSDWTPIAIAIPGVAPLATYTARFLTPRGFLRLRVE